MGKIPETGRGYDAVVIGAGLGGATLAYRLSQQGLRILVLDQGDFLELPAWKPKDPIGVHTTDFPEAGSLVGGQSKFYGAAMYRMRESDFQATRHEAGESPAWPITYQDLEPYYCDAEQLYRVHGSAHGDPTEPLRSADYSYPPLPHAPLVSQLLDRLQGSGTVVSPMPRALDYGPGGRCVLCPTCDAFYCRLDAKMDAEIAALRPALSSGCVELLTRARCLRILTSEAGTKATGVYIERDGTQLTVYGDVVAVCAGVTASANLLLKSKTSRHPLGLGNSSGCVGRYYGGHTAGMIFPLLSFTTRLPAMHTKTFSVNTYYNGAPDWPFPMGVIQAAGQIPFWERNVVPWWKKTAAKFIGERSIYCFYMTEALPTRESGLELNGGQITGCKPPVENIGSFHRLRRRAIDIFKRAGYQVVAPRHRSLWHTIGTARFGTDPETSVLNPDCKVHNIDGLYVMDASVLPSAGAVNTGLTIAALALRAGDIIAGRRLPPARTTAERRGLP